MSNAISIRLPGHEDKFGQYRVCPVLDDKGTSELCPLDVFGGGALNEKEEEEEEKIDSVPGNRLRPLF